MGSPTLQNKKEENIYRQYKKPSAITGNTALDGRKYLVHWLSHNQSDGNKRNNDKRRGPENQSVNIEVFFAAFLFGDSRFY